jgi:membrane-associated phospholipid phosphatase
MSRRIAFGAAGIVILIVAFSRLYLGVHYPSDVAGGFAAGLAWLSLCGITRQIAVTPDARTSHR